MAPACVETKTAICCGEENNSDGIPTIDLSGERSEISKLMVKACEAYGFFKVINHGVSEELMGNVENECVRFFSKPQSSKQAAVGPSHSQPSVFGYGCKTIGFRGDVGEVEYLILNADPLSIARFSQTISDDPPKFCSAVVAYIEAVRNVACKILELIAEGLWVTDRTVFSRLIKNPESDSMLRLNHYFPNYTNCKCNMVGIGEHSDPQILTLLRSNDVPGLQISSREDASGWISVVPDPRALCVNVGDTLQAMTNGQFKSVRHRVMTNSEKSRMSMAYFGGPPLNAMIVALPEMVGPEKPCLYRPFTWAQYKNAAYSLRLGDTRLSLFANST